MTEKLLKIDHKTIFYKDQGKGNPILFVHGWGGSTHSLQALAELASEKYRTIIVDLPGFGKSDKPGTNWGVLEYRELLLKLIKQLELKNLTYFGHSFGGSLGITIAAEHPKLFHRLILCNSAFKRRGVASKKVQLMKRLWRKMSGSSEMPIDTRLEHPNHIKTLATKVEKVSKHILYRVFFPNSDILKYPHLESNFRKIMTEDLTAETEKIVTPTLILWGEEDTYTPVEMAYELHKNIKGSKLKVFPNVRHNLPIKYPELVWEEMEGFLN